LANTVGMKMKYLVLKHDDVNRYLGAGSKIELATASTTIQQSRMIEGKSDNDYLVINTDEPYADEVIEIMKRHGHWG
jgi:hypothetical protein